MLPSEQVARELIVDTNTPGTEIFIIDAEGRVVECGIRKLQAELPLAMYKIRYRVGDRVTESLIELAPGEGPYYAEPPELPIFSAAPSAFTTGTQSDQVTQFSHELIDGPRVDRGTGARLFVFVSADRKSDSPPPANPAAGVSIHKFSGELVEDLANSQTRFGCAGSNLNLDPGHYLLRAQVDAGDPIEQMIVVSPGWQTRVYIRLGEIKTLPPLPLSQPTAPNPTPGWQIDLPQMGVIMVRDLPHTAPGPDDARWTAAARQALAAGRGDAAPNREMMRALLAGKFENPMLGIYAGHLLALQPEPDREILSEVYSNLSSLIGRHPDVDALLIALNDPRAAELTYVEPPMLRASWSLVVRASSAQRDLRPKHSYAARMSASLWGSGAWLSWRMPPPETDTAQPSPEVLQTLISEATAGRLAERLMALADRKKELTPAERMLAAQLMATTKSVQFANELTAEQDSSSFFGGGKYILPAYRYFWDSDLQRQTKQKIAAQLNAEKLSDLTGIPYFTVLEAASTLGQKLGLGQSAHMRSFRRNA